MKNLGIKKLGYEKFGYEKAVYRVEFSKPNIEISITVTKASKPRSLEASKLRSVI